MKEGREREERASRRRPEAAEDYIYGRASRENTGGSWPHSGTSSWVKEHADAPPPPDNGAHVAEPPPAETGPADDGEEARREARRAARRQAKYAEAAGMTPEEYDEERRRRRRREERERMRERDKYRDKERDKDRERDRERRAANSDGSDGRRERDSRRNSAMFGETVTPRSSWWKRLTGGG
jgi:hypothetical protein